MSESSRQTLNNLKKTVFYDLLNLVGRVFIVIKYSDDVVIGNRGFQPEEQKNGLILVFNSRMNFTWENGGLQAHLVFGTSPEKCFIPEENIVAIYSPELETQFTTTYRPDEKRAGQILKPEQTKTKGTGDKKIVKVDFSRKKK